MNSILEPIKNIKPTNAFVGASWACLGLGVLAFLVGLWNADMLLNEKGYYFSLIFFGLFSSVSLQKTVRDKMDGIPVTGIYYGLAWAAMIGAIGLLTVGLWNADLLLSEKGFFGMSYVLAIFASITVQKNIRDLAKLDYQDEHKD